MIENSKIEKPDFAQVFFGDFACNFCAFGFGFDGLIGQLALPRFYMFFALIFMVSFFSGCSRQVDWSKKLSMPRYSDAHELVEFEDGGEVFQLHPDAFAAWERMRDVAKGQGVELHVVSAFRSVERQREIVENKRLRGLCDEEIFKVSARPGYSEHHSGKAIDLTTPGFLELEEEFEYSEAFKWLVDNGSKFGFYLSYPRDNEYGIIYEPWHWCFTEKQV